MENEDDRGGAAPPSAAEPLASRQVDNAIRAIQRKKPVPEIDFTIHVMPDGTEINTTERVCKGMEAILCPAVLLFRVEHLYYYYYYPPTTRHGSRPSPVADGLLLA